MANEHMTPSLARAARAILNWSMADLAARANVAVTTVRDYENGEKQPRRLTQMAFAKVFHEEGIEFLGGEGVVPGLLVHRPELLSTPPRKRSRDK